MPEIIREALRITQLKKIHSGGPFAIMSVYKSDKEKTIDQREFTNSVNKNRHTEFIQELNKKGYKFHAAGGGWYNDKIRQFIPEKSLLIEGIPFNEALALGKRYEQEAIVHKDKDGPVTLYSLSHGSATPAEAIDIVVEMPGVPKSPGPGPRPKRFDPNEPPKTKFRSVEIKYDFRPEKEYFKVSDGPITWDKVKRYLETSEELDSSLEGGHGRKALDKQPEQTEASTPRSPRISKRADDLFRRWNI